MRLFMFAAEIVRIIVLMVLFISVVDWLGSAVYGYFDLDDGRSTLVLGSFLLFFLIYRNYLQFTGWYRSTENKKLPKATSYVIAAAVILLFAAPIFG